MWSLVIWVLATAVLVVGDRGAALGVACGGAVSVGLFSLHRSLVKMWCCAGLRGRARRWLWVIWVAKWPLVGSFLYLALREGQAAPGWMCAGAGLVPAVATVIALKESCLARPTPRADAEIG
jgi:hypothetical protein